MPRIVIFSDLDGCLLNKHDYSFAAAIPVLERIKEAQIPVILASSKTEQEMRGIGEEMALQAAPMICENGGALFWSRERIEFLDSTSHETPVANKTVLGVARSKILELLSELKADFNFQSFRDLQVDGVAAATGLSPEKAADALARSSTEPLLWHDEPDRIDEFRARLEGSELTLTRGGRFWHVAGQTSKGAAMAYVLANAQNWSTDISDSGESPITIAIGDSPIDQSMLDIADYPIGIPTPGGLVQVEVNCKNSRIAKHPGAVGWADSVSEVLDELGGKQR